MFDLVLSNGNTQRSWPWLAREHYGSLEAHWKVPAQGQGSVDVHADAMECQSVQCAAVALLRDLAPLTPFGMSSVEKPPW